MPAKFCGELWSEGLFRVGPQEFIRPKQPKLHCERGDICTGMVMSVKHVRGKMVPTPEPHSSASDTPCVYLDFRIPLGKFIPLVQVADGCEHGGVGLVNPSRLMLSGGECSIQE